jgi:uncharacterized protein (TIGR02145 family)
MKKKLWFFLLMILSFAGLSTCSKEEPIPISGDQELGMAFFLTTDDINYITCVNACSGGYIIDNVGGSGVLSAMGVCWSTTPNPTTANNKTIDAILSDLLCFHSILTGLNCETTYYVRAYAINSAGTTYGNEVSFTTPASIDVIVNNTNIAQGLVSDIEGNIYNTIQTGTQTWMAENLKTTKYCDGSPISPGIGAPAGYTDWFDCGDGNYLWYGGAYCWYENDASAYKDAYGAIYNWHAVGTGKLCPTGWHVPTISDWTTLIKTLGGTVEPFNEPTSNAMINCSDNSINESGFTYVTHGELCGWGFLMSDFWWSATPMPTELRVPYAYIIGWVLNSVEPQSYGYSVRCLKD